MGVALESAQSLCKCKRPMPTSSGLLGFSCYVDLRLSLSLEQRGSMRNFSTDRSIAHACLPLLHVRLRHYAGATTSSCWLRPAREQDSCAHVAVPRKSAHRRSDALPSADVVGQTTHLPGALSHVVTLQPAHAYTNTACAAGTTDREQQLHRLPLHASRIECNPPAAW